MADKIVPVGPSEDSGNIHSLLIKGKKISIGRNYSAHLAEAQSESGSVLGTVVYVYSVGARVAEEILTR